MVEATTAVSWFAPLSMVMVWPALKPAALATGMTVAPALVAVPTVVAPAVPTVAMTAVSRFAPVSIMIVWPAAKSATLATLILVAPAAEAADRVVAACSRKSVQWLSASTPSGKRPRLLLRRRRPAGRRRAGHHHDAAALALVTLEGGDLGAGDGPVAARVALLGSVDHGVDDHRAAGVHQRDRAGPGGEGAPEPLIGRRRPLVTHRRGQGVDHGRAVRVALGQRAVERDAAAQRLHRVAARVRELRGRREADPRPHVGHVDARHVVELERGGQVDARAGRAGACRRS